MARIIGGASHNITVSTGAIAAGNASCLAMVRVTSTATDGTPVHEMNAAGPTFYGFLIRNSAGRELQLDTTGTSNGTTGLALNTWYIVGYSKATGTTTPRFHIYNCETRVWVHENGSATNGNGSIVSVVLGYNGTPNGSMSMAWAGHWNKELSDAQVEAIALSRWRLLMSAPAAFWMFDQAAVTQKIIDATGNGSNESARTGTTVSDQSVPLFTYGASPTLVTRPQAAPAGGDQEPALVGGKLTESILTAHLVR